MKSEETERLVEKFLGQSGARKRGPPGSTAVVHGQRMLWKDIWKVIFPSWERYRRDKRGNLRHRWASPPEKKKKKKSPIQNHKKVTNPGWDVGGRQSMAVDQKFSCHTKLTPYQATWDMFLHLDESEREILNWLSLNVNWQKWEVTYVTPSPNPPKKSSNGAILSCVYHGQKHINTPPPQRLKQHKQQQNRTH